MCIRDSPTCPATATETASQAVPSRSRPRRGLIATAAAGGTAALNIGHSSRHTCHTVWRSMTCCARRAPNSWACTCAIQNTMPVSNSSSTSSVRGKEPSVPAPITTEAASMEP